MGRAYKQVSIQYNCTKFYSFRVTKPIIGAGRWHGPKMTPTFYSLKGPHSRNTHEYERFSNIEMKVELIWANSHTSFLNSCKSRS